MKIVITGGAGFIGSHLAEHYRDRGEVVVVDNFRTGRRENLDGIPCRLVEGSVLDANLLARTFEGADVVFHLAALVSVPESMSALEPTVAINVLGCLRVLEAARRAGVGRLCFASSAAVYGENPATPKTETLPPDPRSPYAITKLDGEAYCDLFAREAWLSTVALRFFNVFGPRQDPASAYAAAVPIFIQQALRDEPLVIHGDGGQTRDFIYVKDVVGALSFLAERPEVHGVFNAGYGGRTTVRELAESVVRLADSASPITFAPPRTGDIRDSQASPARLRAVGWRPAFTFEEGLRETVRAFRAGAVTRRPVETSAAR